MGEMTELTLEAATHQWLSEHPGNTEDDYQESMAEREADLQTSSKERRAEEIEQLIHEIMCCLKQGKSWIVKGQKNKPISDISPRHAQNIIGWLRRRADLFHDQACWEMMDMQTDSSNYDEAFNSLNEMDPVEWVMQTPLVVNLKKKIRKSEEAEDARS